MASFVKGGTFEVKQQRPISYSYSNQEYLIVNKGTVLGWVLSQDIEGGYGSDRVGEANLNYLPDLRRKKLRLLMVMLLLLLVRINQAYLLQQLHHCIRDNL